uniref:MYND-type domain-containing protein n=1 Tax=Parascaris equorum TaxID=6256 RepID=A0A914R808_PAREQ
MNSEITGTMSMKSAEVEQGFVWVVFSPDVNEPKLEWDLSNENKEPREDSQKSNEQHKPESACKTAAEEKVNCFPGTLEFYPFAYALYNSHLDENCWYCLSPSANLSLFRRCKGCNKAMFCDQNCQTLGWKDHKAECRALKSTPTVPDIEVRLLGRIITRFKASRLIFSPNHVVEVLSLFYFHPTRFIVFK